MLNLAHCDDRAETEGKGGEQVRYSEHATVVTSICDPWRFQRASGLDSRRRQRVGGHGLKFSHPPSPDCSRQSASCTHFKLRQVTSPCRMNVMQASETRSRMLFSHFVERKCARGQLLLNSASL